VSFDPQTQGYTVADQERFFRDLLDGARAMGGAAAVGLARLPIQGGARTGGPGRPEGLPRDDPRAVSLSTNLVSPGFIDAVGLELIEGRDFRMDEIYRGAGLPGVALVSEAAARGMFADGSAVGQRVDLGFGTPRIVEIVGVFRDARLYSVKEGADAFLFEPLGQRAVPAATLYVRGAGDRAPSLEGVEALVADLDPALPAFDVQPLSRRVDVGMTVERILARLVGLFAGLALLLAAVGIYGVMATAVHGRTRELGVRLALGASGDSVRSMVLVDALRVTVIGVAAGALASTQLTQLIGTRLWGVRPLDPIVFGVAAGTLVVAAAAAAWVPARRATRVDPVAALRAG